MNWLTFFIVLLVITLWKLPPHDRAFVTVMLSIGAATIWVIWSVLNGHATDIDLAAYR